MTVGPRRTCIYYQPRRSPAAGCPGATKVFASGVTPRVRLYEYGRFALIYAYRHQRSDVSALERGLSRLVDDRHVLTFLIRANSINIFKEIFRRFLCRIRRCSLGCDMEDKGTMLDQRRGPPLPGPLGMPDVSLI